jgi:hypothetical protein
MQARDGRGSLSTETVTQKNQKGFNVASEIGNGRGGRARFQFD